MPSAQNPCWSQRFGREHQLPGFVVVEDIRGQRLGVAGTYIVPSENQQAARSDPLKFTYDQWGAAGQK